MPRIGGGGGGGARRRRIGTCRAGSWDEGVYAMRGVGSTGIAEDGTYGIPQSREDV